MKLVSEKIKDKKNIYHIDNIKNIECNDVFHYCDVFDVDEVQKIFDLKGKPASFISDGIIHYEDFIDDVKFIGLPLWLENQRQAWNLDEFNDTEHKTNSCFNFMINKKQINRYLCIKLVELFRLQSFVYTWSGVDNSFDCSQIIQEHQDLGKLSPLSSNQFSEILSTIRLQPFFYSGYLEKDMQYNDSRVVQYGGNRNSWDWGCSKIFSESAVSLITESLDFQKASIFTEKTLYSLLGLTFPIWIGGGAKQAEMWKKIGFDIFDDVINHDYQYYDTLLERCCYAFIFNQKILTDLDYATSVRNRNMDRLNNNRSLILSGKLSEYIHDEVGKNFYVDNNFENSFKNGLDMLLKKFQVAV